MGPKNYFIPGVSWGNNTKDLDFKRTTHSWSHISQALVLLDLGTTLLSAALGACWAVQEPFMPLMPMEMRWQVCWDTNNTISELITWHTPPQSWNKTFMHFHSQELEFICSQPSAAKLSVSIPSFASIWYHIFQD